MTDVHAPMQQSKLQNYNSGRGAQAYKADYQNKLHRKLSDRRERALLLRYFAEIGFGKEAEAIQAAFALQDYDAMAKACPDEMITAITILGSATEVQKQVAERAQYADAITPVVPQFGIEPEKAAIYRKRIANLFYV